jgi:poly(A) polymerase
VEAEIGKWWERFKDAGEEERSRMLVPDGAGGKRKRRRRPRGKAGKEAVTVDPVS